jgi:hypothetical protein
MTSHAKSFAGAATAEKKLQQFCWLGIVNARAAE